MIQQELPDNICKYGATAEQLQEYNFLTNNQRLILIARHNAFITLEKIKSICKNNRLSIRKYRKSINKHYIKSYQDDSQYFFYRELLLTIAHECR